MANFIAGVIGNTGQNKLGEALASMISNSVCEGINKSFEGPLLKIYEDLLKDVGTKWKDDNTFMKKVEEIIETIDVAEFKVESKEPALMSVGGDKTRGRNPLIDGLPITSEITGVGDFATNIAKGMSTNDMLKTASSANYIATTVKGMGTEGLSKLKGMTNGLTSAATSGISGITDAAKSLTLTAGLAPNDQAVPDLLKEFLNREVVKTMMEDGINNFVKHLNDNPEKMTKMFMDILKEQINAKFNEEPGNSDFKKVIINTIQKKCAKLDKSDEEEDKEILDNNNGGEGKNRGEEEGEENKNKIYPDPVNIGNVTNNIPEIVVKNADAISTANPVENNTNLLDTINQHNGQVLTKNINIPTNQRQTNAQNVINIQNPNPLFGLGNEKSEGFTNVFNNILKKQGGKSKKRTTRKIKTNSK